MPFLLSSSLGSILSCGHHPSLDCLGFCLSGRPPGSLGGNGPWPQPFFPEDLWGRSPLGALPREGTSGQNLEENSFGLNYLDDNSTTPLSSSKGPNRVVNGDSNSHLRIWTETWIVLCVGDANLNISSTTASWDIWIYCFPSYLALA